MRRILHIALLVFSLLFAQGAMAAHSASHVATAGHAGDKGLPSDAACDLCISHAQLSGAAPLPVTPALPVCTASHEAPDADVTLFVSTSVVHSRARAPPVSA
jgi:hypothetical protein